MSSIFLVSAAELVRNHLLTLCTSSFCFLKDVVRAVAGFLHHMQVPVEMAPVNFDSVYEQGLEYYKARRKNDETKSGRVSIQYCLLKRQITNIQ